MLRKESKVKGSGSRPKQSGPVKNSGAWKMPPPIPSGEILTDFSKRQWKICGSIGKGGFGEIYLATGKDKSTDYVIKVEPHENGPLFTELAFYRRAATSELIDDWMSSKELEYLSIPKFISAGVHSKEKTDYRFMVMERYGDDIEKLFCTCSRRFNIKTVCYLALRLLEALEYLHDNEYVHADIKGSNLLTGYKQSDRHKVYLVDYGLAYRYGPEDQHKEYKEDPKKCHDGTIEFTSIDAHKGVVPSRRGDMEILGYCLLQWGCGRLPWEGCLDNKPEVAKLKQNYKSNVKKLMSDCFKGGPVPSCLQEYMKIVYSLGYKDRPNYEELKKLFLDELKRNKMKDDRNNLDWIDTTTKRKKGFVSDDEIDEVREKEMTASPPKKLKKSSDKVSSKVPKQKVKKKSGEANILELKKELLETSDSEIDEEDFAPAKKKIKVSSQLKVVPSATRSSSRLANKKRVDYSETSPVQIRKTSSLKQVAKKKDTDIPNGHSEDSDSDIKQSRKHKVTKGRPTSSEVIPGVPDKKSSSDKIPNGHYPASLGYTQ